MKKPFMILLLVCLLALVAVSFSAGGVLADSHLGINEVRIDQPSTDNDEYFELYGPASASLNDYTYIVLGDGVGGSGDNRKCCVARRTEYQLLAAISLRPRRPLPWAHRIW